MNQIVLKQLMEEQGYPCISLLLSTYRTAPDYHKNEVKIRKIIREAEERLLKEMTKREAQPYIDRLKKLAEKIDISRTMDGLALFVNERYSEKVDLPFPVRERVVIDKTFATRDIIMTVNRGISFYTLVLGIDKVRLLQCYRDEAVDVEQKGFPMFSELDFYELNPTDLSRERAKKVKEFFSRVSRVLKELNNFEKQPLVIMGVEKNLGFFREAAGLDKSVIASIEGSYITESAHDIGKKVWPRVKEIVSQKRNESVKDLEAAVGAGKYASEISNVWRFANEGRVRLLLAEENYHQSCRLNDNNTILPINKPEKGMIDDAVDEIAEMVLNKGGDVVFTDDGVLKDYNSIAAVLRY